MQIHYALGIWCNSICATRLTVKNKRFNPVQIVFAWENQQYSGLQLYILELKTNENQQEKLKQLVLIIINRYRIRYLL